MVVAARRADEDDEVGEVDEVDAEKFVCPTSGPGR